VFTSFERAFDLHERLVNSEETYTLDQFFCARDSLLIPLKGSNAGTIVASYPGMGTIYCIDRFDNPLNCNR
jgi:hypothetical protein